MERIRTPTLVAGVAAVSAVVTLLVGGLPGLHLAQRNPELHVTLVTGEALIAPGRTWCSGASVTAAASTT